MLLFSPQLVSADSLINNFEKDSYRKILNAYHGHAFLMVLWSVDCPPCIDELSVLGQFHQLYPSANIVLVSTDNVVAREEISQLMQLHDLNDVQQWVFDGDSIAAIRHAIDPLWYGELPRSYFHYTENQRQGISGRLDKIKLLVWFKATDKTAKGF